MSVAVYDANFFYGNFEVESHERNQAGIRLIALCFFFKTNFKMVFGLFIPRFLLRPCYHPYVYIQFILGKTNTIRQ